MQTAKILTSVLLSGNCVLVGHKREAARYRDRGQVAGLWGELLAKRWYYKPFIDLFFPYDFTAL